jgi:hypothetical protein
MIQKGHPRNVVIVSRGRRVAHPVIGRSLLNKFDWCNHSGDIKRSIRNQVFASGKPLSFWNKGYFSP